MAGDNSLDFDDRDLVGGIIVISDHFLETRTDRAGMFAPLGENQATHETAEVSKQAEGQQHQQNNRKNHPSAAPPRRRRGRWRHNHGGRWLQRRWRSHWWRSRINRRGRCIVIHSLLRKLAQTALSGKCISKTCQTPLYCCLPQKKPCHAWSKRVYANRRTT